MTKRQEKLLKTIITEYIKTAQPVASEYIADKFNLQISPATIRNEMSDLTRKGYLSQPHTSAGRIPTLLGFEYYIRNLLEKSLPNKTERKALQSSKQKALSLGYTISASERHEIVMKHMAQQVAALSGELSILIFDGTSFYYTGLSYLFSQPEFEQHELVYNISQIVDHLDKVMNEIFESIGDETEILIGKKNPFSSLCSAIFARCKLPSRRSSNVIGLLGPVRMDYDRNLGLINYIKELLDH